MKKIGKYFTLLVVLFFSIANANSQITFKAKGPQFVNVGEGFTVSYTINADKPNHFQAPTVNGARIVAGPYTSSSSSTTIINGKVSSSHSYTFSFTLQAQKTGVVNISPAKVDINGKTYTSNSLKIEVGTASSNKPNTNNRTQNNYSPSFNRPTAASQSDKEDINIDSKAMFVRAFADKSDVVKGEEIVLTYKLYTLLPVSEYQIEKIPTSSGFWTEEPDNQERPSLTTEIIDGQKYQTAILRKVILYPQKTGKLSIAPMKLSVTAHVARQRRNNFSTGDPFFDQFFNNPFFSSFQTNYQKVTKSLYTNSVTINVKEIVDKTSDWSGAVGNFNITANISTDTAKAFEPFYLIYTLTGKGNLTLVNSLPIDLPDEFQFSDPEITDNIQRTTSGLHGSRTFKYLIIPRVQGDFKIPELNIEYYNSDINKLEKINTEGFNIHILKGETNNGYATQLDNRAKYRNMDIKTPVLKTLHHKQYHIFDNAVIFVLSALVILLTVISIVSYRKYIDMTADVVNMKRKKATKVAVKRLKKAKKLLDNNKITEFEDEIANSLWTYLSDRFKIKKTELSIQNCKDMLLKANVNEQTVETLGTILDRCQYLRFSQDKLSEADQTLYNDTLEVITTIEQDIKQIKKRLKNMPEQNTVVTHSGISLGFFALLLSLPLLFAPAETKASNNNELLKQANQLYSAKNYDSALVVYNKIAQKEISADIYLNIGNTYFRQSEYAQAVLYYEKALKLAPKNKTIIHNINVTRSRLVGECYIMPDFVLIRFFKSSACCFSVLQWAVIFSVLLVLSCVLFFAYRFSENKKVLLFYLFLTASILCIISFSLGIYRQHLQNDDTNAIVMKSNTKIFEDKNSNGKTLMILYKGQKIKITEDNGGNWIKIRTEDRKEGYMENKNYKKI